MKSTLGNSCVTLEQVNQVNIRECVSKIHDKIDRYCVRKFMKWSKHWEGKFTCYIGTNKPSKHKE